MKNADCFFTNRLIWAALFGLAACTALWVAAEGLGVDATRAMRFFYIYAMFAAISLIYRFLRRDDNLYLLGHLANQWLTTAAILGVLSYVSSRLNFPLTDAALINLDLALGFDWKSYVAWVDKTPWLADLFTYAYFSSGPQIMVLVALLFLCKHTAHNQRFLIAFILTALVTVVLAALFPAVGGYVYYDIDVHTHYQNIHPAAARIHEADLMAMRNHTMSVLAFPLQGLVTFPSFHSALSIVLIYAAWPVWWLRIIALPLNIVILFSTPVDGGHYLTDILGGVVIALMVIALVERVFNPKTAVTQSSLGLRPTQW